MNRYVDYNRPWDLAKKDPARLATVLHVSARAAVSAAGLLWPVMPEKCDEALACFGVDASQLEPTHRWSGDLLEPGKAVTPVSSLFPRRDAKDAEPTKTKDKKPSPAVVEAPAPSEVPAAKAIIQYDDFLKLDLRVATILEAEAHPQADKLVKLIVNLGTEKRQIIAGIAEHFAPADLVGKQVVVVANLAPRKLRGLESQGMLLAAHDSHGLRLITPSDTTEPGSTVS